MAILHFMPGKGILLVLCLFVLQSEGFRRGDKSCFDEILVQRVLVEDLTANMKVETPVLNVTHEAYINTSLAVQGKVDIQGVVSLSRLEGREGQFVGPLYVGNLTNANVGQDDLAVAGDLVVGEDIIGKSDLVVDGKATVSDSLTVGAITAGAMTSTGPIGAATLTASAGHFDVLFVSSMNISGIVNIPSIVSDSISVDGIHLPDHMHELGEQLQKLAAQMAGFKEPTWIFQRMQQIATYGAYSWKHWVNSEGDSFLVVANRRNGSNVNAYSEIFRRNNESGQYESFQLVLTHGAYDWEVFQVEKVIYLIVANHYDGSNPNINSVLYQWSNVTGQFENYQEIPTHGATHWEHWMKNDTHFLGVSNYRDGISYDIDSQVFVWNETTARLELYQSFPAHGAFDIATWDMNGELYMAVACHHNHESGFLIKSQVLRWSDASELFESYQEIQTCGAADWEHWEDDEGQHFLAVANSKSSEVENLVDSEIFVWNGTYFESFQRIPTSGATSWRHFVAGKRHYLAISNEKDNTKWNVQSKIYQLNKDGTAFESYQQVLSQGALKWEYWQEVNGDIMLALANHFEGSESEIFRFVWV